ncbi:hypothetical protein ACFXAZ_04555 [Streptomyces sp. NPDC059477]|uniref:hypothetical protein n=1 Tax=Streptomyces sp. NPDC059477 TaxID=3346847 RepID=UPI0036C6324E
MLARLPLGYPILMVVCATALLSLAIHVTMRLPRKVQVFLWPVSALFCVLMIGDGAARPRPFDVRQSLVMFAFAWGGLALGLLLLAGPLRAYGVEARRPGPPPAFPAGYVFVLCMTTVTMMVLGFFLAT